MHLTSKTGKKNWIQSQRHVVQFRIGVFILFKKFKFYSEFSPKNSVGFQPIGLEQVLEVVNTKYIHTGIGNRNRKHFDPINRIANFILHTGPSVGAGDAIGLVPAAAAEVNRKLAFLGHPTLDIRIGIWFSENENISANEIEEGLPDCRECQPGFSWDRLRPHFHDQLRRRPSNFEKRQLDAGCTSGTGKETRAPNWCQAENLFTACQHSVGISRTFGSHVGISQNSCFKGAQDRNMIENS